MHGVDGSGETVKINMNKVKFVPGLSTNLISVGQLVQKGFKVSFANATCGIVNADGEVVATGSRLGKLYYLNIAQVSLAATDDRSHRQERPVSRSKAAAKHLVNSGLTSVP